MVIMKGLGECEPRTGDKTKCYFCFTYALLLRLIESHLLSLNVTLLSERGKNRPILKAFFVSGELRG